MRRGLLPQIFFWTITLIITLIITFLLIYYRNKIHEINNRLMKMSAYGTVIPRIFK